MSNVGLEFRLGTDPETGLVAISTTQLINPPSIIDFTPSIECSFAGGCEIYITSYGLKQSIISNPDDTYIAVCGKRCVLDE